MKKNIETKWTGWSVAALILAGALAPLAINAQTAATNAVPAVATNAQAELIQKLLDRVDQLEKQEAQRAETGQKVQDEQVQKLLGRIGELETKVKSLESGQVLPEIAVSPADGPSNHELDQKIRILQRNNELATEADAARAKESAKLIVGANGFTIASGDTNFVLKFRGLIQVDSRSFLDDNESSQGNDGFILRRARPILEGTVYRDFDFLLTPDYTSSSMQLIDSYINYRYTPALQARIGKFKGPLGLENIQSDTVGSFNERGLTYDLFPTRNVGFQLWGDIAGGIVSYSAGVFNGTGDARNSASTDFNDNQEYAGRIFLHPFKQTDINALKGLGIGLGGSYAELNQTKDALPNTTGGPSSVAQPGYFTAGQQQFFAYNSSVVADGTHWRLSPQAYYYWGAFGLLGEYGISDQGVLNTATGAKASLQQKAWQVSAQWVLTGEPASFTGIVPAHPFDPHKGQWGAWQLVARYNQLDIDDDAFDSFASSATSASKATGWSVGINWWLNRNIRLLTSYSHTWFDGGGGTGTSAPAAVTQQDEDVIFTRVQLAF